MSKSFKYVSDFQFPSECGFTGSAGKTQVKGYARGGKVEPAKPVAMRRGGRTSPNMAAPAPATPAAPPPRADVTTNEAGQKVFVSRPTPPAPVAPVATTATQSSRGKRNRNNNDDDDRLYQEQRRAAQDAKKKVEQEYRQKSNEIRSRLRLPDNSGFNRAAVKELRDLQDAYRPQMKAQFKGGGEVARKSYPTNKSEPMIKAKTGDMNKKVGKAMTGKQAMMAAMSEARKGKK